MIKVQKGFTLVEVLLVVLIVIFIVALSINIPSSLKLVGDSQYSSTAKDIASQKIEDARSQTYDNLADGVSNPWDDRLTNLPSASLTEMISDCSPQICTHGEPIKQVMVEVHWTENGSNKSVQLTTLIAKGGLK